jgi:spermidine/putrescine transport system permease protein
MATAPNISDPIRRGPRRRSGNGAAWLMLAPAVGGLALFLLFPLYYVFLYSVGMRYLEQTPALAELDGHFTSFTLTLWHDFLAPDVYVKVLGGSSPALTVPSWVVGITLVALIALTLLGTRISAVYGGRISLVSALVLVSPFATIPWGDGLLRVAELTTSQDSIYLRLFFKSVSMAMTSSIFAVLFAFPIAYYMAFVLKKTKYTWILIVITPFLTSYLLRVFAWTIILGDQGLVNTTLQKIGLIDQPLTWLLYTQFTVIVVLTYAWVPFICLPIFIALENIDRRLLEAATDLGASRFRAFAKITLPLAAPGMVAAFLFVFIPSIGEYVTPSLVGGTKGYMYGNGIQTQFTGGALDWQTGAVLALFLVVVVLMLTGATSRFLRAGGGAR